MPKITQSAPKYRKHKASGRAVVTLAGRDYYLGPYGTRTSRAEYDRLVGEWLASGRRPRSADDSETATVVELSAAYLKWAERYYRKNGQPTRTIERVRLALKVLRASYGHTLVTAFGPLALQAVQHKLVLAGKSRRYVNYLIAEIKRIFKWGVAQELVPADVFHGLATVSGLRKGRTDAAEAEPVLPVDDRTVEATLPHLPRIVADMVRLQRLTGMRPGEVCILRPCDVDRSADVWRYRPAEHKTEHHGRERVVFMGPKAQAILLPYLLRDSQAYCFSPAERMATESAERRSNRRTPLTPSQRCRRPRRNGRRRPGDRYDTGGYGNAIRRACNAAFPAPADLSDADKKLWQRDHVWTPNRLRHAAATEIRSKHGLDAAQTILGHAHARVTEIYAERDHARAAAIVREVG